MGKLYFDGVGVKIQGEGAETLKCCEEGQSSVASVEHAVLLQGKPGFDDYTDEAIAYRERRSAVAMTCVYAQTGECALEQSCMLSATPPTQE